VRRLWPGRELFATLSFAWSPFVLMRASGNGHNDLVMMAFAVAAVYFAIDHRWRLVLPLLTLSILVKFSTLLLVPPVLVYAWTVSTRGERRELAWSAAGSALMALAIFFPFWNGADTFKTFVQNTNLVITSVPQLVTVAWKGGAAAGTVDGSVKAAGYAAFGAVYLALLWALTRRPAFETLLTALTLTMIAYLTLNTWWFRPWYLLWFLPFAAMLARPWWTAIAVALAAGATSFDLIEQYRVHWPWIWEHTWRTYAAPVLPVFVPLVFLLLAALAVTGSWKLESSRSGAAAASLLTGDPSAL
jgi:alpha-1,6-mannosyltransferase